MLFYYCCCYWRSCCCCYYQILLILKCIYFFWYYKLLFKLQRFTVDREDVHIALCRLHWPTTGCVQGNNIARRQRELEQQKKKKPAVIQIFPRNSRCARTMEGAHARTSELHLNNCRTPDACKKFPSFLMPFWGGKPLEPPPHPHPTPLPSSIGI